MKKFFKNNLKTILTVGATAVICISGTAFAAFQYNAKQVEYKDGKSVETALNELYSKKNIHRQNSNQIPEGITNIKLVVLSIATGGIGSINISGDIIISTEKTDLKYDFVSRQYEMGLYEYNINTTGHAGTINIDFNGFGTKTDYYFLYY